MLFDNWISVFILKSVSWQILTREDKQAKISKLPKTLLHLNYLRGSWVRSSQTCTCNWHNLQCHLSLHVKIVQYFCLFVVFEFLPVWENLDMKSLVPCLSMLEMLPCPLRSGFDLISGLGEILRQWATKGIPCFGLQGNQLVFEVFLKDANSRCISFW